MPLSPRVLMPSETEWALPAESRAPTRTHTHTHDMQTAESSAPWDAMPQTIPRWGGGVQGVTDWGGRGGVGVLKTKMNQTAKLKDKLMKLKIIPTPNLTKRGCVIGCGSLPLAEIVIV